MRVTLELSKQQQPPVSYRRSAFELHSLTGRNLLQSCPVCQDGFSVPLAALCHTPSALTQQQLSLNSSPPTPQEVSKWIDQHVARCLINTMQRLSVHRKALASQHAFSQLPIYPEKFAESLLKYQPNLCKFSVPVERTYGRRVIYNGSANPSMKLQ